MVKVTLVLGASPNPDRFSYKAVLRLHKRGIPVIAFGRRESEIGGIPISKKMPGKDTFIHTIALYMNAENQHEYYEKILALNPARIIFNPGTENPEFADIARKAGIVVVENCLLEMLNTGRF